MVLFLDFDGVTHPEPCFSPEKYFSALPLIESVIREFDDLDIVISSNWRKTDSLASMIAPFAEDIRPRIVGVTPIEVDVGALPEGLHAYEREAQCVSWMRANRPAYCPWVAIDDRPYWFQPFCKNLFTVEDCTLAFEEHHVPLLRQTLSDAIGATSI